MLAVVMGTNDFQLAPRLERSSVVCASKQTLLAQPRDHLEHESSTLQQLQESPSLVVLRAGVEWRPEHFPHKMYDLLEDVELKGLGAIVSWLPNGKSFKIHSQVEFEKSIMPMYFSGMGSYKSFRRQLNLYGIYQHRHRPNQDANAYSHELFVRGQRNLCDKIIRKKTTPPATKKNKASSSPKKTSKSGTDTDTSKKRRRFSLVSAMMDERNRMNPCQPSEARPTVSSRLVDAHVAPVPIESSPNANAADDIVRRTSTLAKDNDSSSPPQPNPVDVRNIRVHGGRRSSSTSRRAIGAINAFHQSFLGQYWEDLPRELSSVQVMDEIIATFATTTTTTTPRR